jgi:hypothetical protein
LDVPGVATSALEIRDKWLASVRLLVDNPARKSPLVVHVLLLGETNRVVVVSTLEQLPKEPIGPIVAFGLDPDSMRA